MIKQIDINKSSAITDMKSVFIKDAFISLNFEVAYFLNESLRKCEFPSSWGHCSVTPIPKEGDHLDPGNWRPITEMPVKGRLVEKAIHLQLRYFIDSTGLLHINQQEKALGPQFFSIQKNFIML